MIDNINITMKTMNSKGMIFYTDNQLNLKIAHAVQNQLKKISKDKSIPIVSCSLKPMPHFGKNIYFKGERGCLTMFKQILTALRASKTEVLNTAKFLKKT